MPYKALIEFEKLKAHFGEPMADVARKFGVCTTFFKRICRTHGIKRWPYRKLQSIQKKISTLAAADPTAHSCQKLSDLKVALKSIESTGCREVQGQRFSGSALAQPLLRELPLMTAAAGPTQFHPVQIYPEVTYNVIPTGYHMAHEFSRQLSLETVTQLPVSSMGFVELQHRNRFSQHCQARPICPEKPAIDEEPAIDSDYRDEETSEESEESDEEAVARILSSMGQETMAKHMAAQ